MPARCARARSCSRTSGTRTGTAPPRPSTCTWPRCARSSVIRGGSRRCAASGSGCARSPTDGRRRTVKRRLLVSYLSITAFVLLVLAIPLGVSYSNSVERRLTSDLQHDAFALATRARAPLADGASVEPTRSLQDLAARYSDSAGGRVVIVDSDGRSIADSDAGSPVGRDFSRRLEIDRA